jgi:hypothetical protein
VWRDEPKWREGRYRLRVCYASPAGCAFGEVLSIVLRRPDAAEEERLRLLEPAVRRAGSWGRWARLPPEAGEPPEPPLTADDPLRYPRVVRELLFRSDPPTRRDLALLDCLDRPGSVYAPEAAAWRAELLQLLGDDAGFDAQAAVVSCEHPGLAWWMERLRRGLGMLAWQRGSRRESPIA